MDACLVNGMIQITSIMYLLYSFFSYLAGILIVTNIKTECDLPTIKMK